MSDFQSYIDDFVRQELLLHPIVDVSALAETALVAFPRQNRENMIRCISESVVAQGGNASWRAPDADESIDLFCKALSGKT